MIDRLAPVTLRVNLAESPITKALRDGRVTSDLVHFEFCGPKAAHEGFKPMVRGNAFDAGELALATFLLAKYYNKPYCMLPAVMSGGFHHTSIAYNADFGGLMPKDIEGRRVAVRSYTQTTGVWVRGFLSQDYGVDLDRVTWVCSDEAHVAEYPEPSSVQRAASRKDLTQMLIEGEIAALITGIDSLSKYASLRPLIPDAQVAAEAWSAKHHAIPINHVFVINSELAQRRPEVVREVYRMLLESRRLAGAHPKSYALNFGFDANRNAIEIFCKWAVDQKIVPRQFTPCELFADAAAPLGDLAS